MSSAYSDERGLAWLGGAFDLGLTHKLANLLSEVICILFVIEPPGKESVAVFHIDDVAGLFEPHDKWHWGST
jgi:hypothetical protein